MKCPGCKKLALFQIELDRGLKAFECKNCGGLWLPAVNYYTWLKQVDDLPEIMQADRAAPVFEDSAARISPESGRILRRYKVWPEVEFYIERDETTNSIWLDKGEWEYLKARNLHDNIHTFFTAVWQDELKDQESGRKFEAMYLKRFGEADYAKLKDFREWIYGHPKSSALIAYLTDRDPYRA